MFEASELLSLDAQPRATQLLAGAVAHPVHAYLFHGPRGTGKRAGALAFAAALIATDERTRRLALTGQHPDLSIHEPEGRSLRVAEADEIIFEASRSPAESSYKVIVCDRFHTAEPEAVASLLKTIEEPPPKAVVILLSEEIPPTHITVASRCVLVEFDPIDDAEMRRLLQAQSVPTKDLAGIITAANGDLRRARLLATDEGLQQRTQAWTAAIQRFDGTGHLIAMLVKDLQQLIDEAQAPLQAQQKAESEELARTEDSHGKQAGQRQQMESRHRREQRLLRTDELKFGLATMAEFYRQQLADEQQNNPRHAKDAIVAIGHLRQAHASLIRNPNEALLLQSLFCKLSAI